MIPVDRRRARRAARRASAWRPTPAPSACCAGRTSRCCPPRWRIPPRRRGPRAALPRAAPRRAPLPALRGPGGRSAARLRHLRLGRRRPWTSSRACTAPPSMRWPACRVRLLVTVGRDRDPAELGPLPANVRVERWVPQADLMPHVAAMVCHGGSGTVTMGLAGGVPMAVVPLFADQPWNAERVDALGAGIALGARPARRSPGCARRSSGSPATRRTAPAPSGSPPRCARCRRSTPRSASCAGCWSTGSPHERAQRQGPCASESTSPMRASRRAAPPRRSSSTGG